MNVRDHLGHVIVCTESLEGAARIQCLNCDLTLVQEGAGAALEEEGELCAFCGEHPAQEEDDLCLMCNNDDDVQFCAPCGTYYRKSEDGCATGNHHGGCCECITCDACGNAFGDHTYCADCAPATELITCTVCGRLEVEGCGEDGEFEQMCKACYQNRDVLQCKGCNTWFNVTEGGTGSSGQPFSAENRCTTCDC